MNSLQLEELAVNLKTIKTELACLFLKVNTINKQEYLKRLKIIESAVDSIECSKLFK